MGLNEVEFTPYHAQPSFPLALTLICAVVQALESNVGDHRIAVVIYHNLSSLVTLEAQSCSAKLKRWAYSVGRGDTVSSCLPWTLARTVIGFDRIYLNPNMNGNIKVTIVTHKQ